MEEGVPIESKMISNRIEAAQKAVRILRSNESRKHLLEYDDVMNKQREAVYGLRRRLPKASISASSFSKTTSAESSATCLTNSSKRR